MSDPPTLDGRDEAALASDFRSRADDYLPAWDPTTTDPGTDLLDVGAGFGARLLDHVANLPSAHRVAFADLVGIQRCPPEPARLPLSFTLSPSADGNVPIPADTAAETADGERFTTTADTPVEATPAALVAAYAVDPETDRIVDHTASLAGDGPTDLFTGPDCRGRRLFLGEDCLDAAAGTVLTVAVETDTPSTFAEGVTWEYHGEDAEGESGWHSLPRVDADEGTPTVDGIRDRRAASSPAGTVRVQFRLPGPTTPVTVDGAEGYWLRCRAEDVDPTATVRGVSVSVGRSGVAPAAAVANDVPLSTDGDFSPFGRTPQPPSTLYLRSAAFAHPGATVELTVGSSTEGDEADDSHPPAPETVPVAAGPPTLSWEYHDGDGWTPLGVTDDGTDQFRTAGTVAFTVPEDAAETTVSGHRGAWIRVRLVAGSYRDTVPSFDGVTVDARMDAATPTLVSGADGSATHVQTFPARPFEGRPDTERALYLGFDEPLSGGPLSLLWSLADPDADADPPTLCWERYRPDADAWQAISVDDRTAGVTADGTVGLQFDDATTATTAFGETRHWLRVRAVEGWPAPPAIETVAVNAVWAHNARSVTDAVLGSSEGTADQTFDCPDSPVAEPTLWVDESGALSSARLQSLREGRPDAVEVDGESIATADAVWVRWTARPDLLGAGPDDRVYTLDDGTVRFGDGEEGSIPPAGTDNVRIDYRTGGGSGGNVPAGAVDTLVSSVPAVASVTNPLAGAGGTDAESRERATERAGVALRTRGRAVTAADVAEVVRATDRSVARVTCSRLDGGIAVAVVPDETAPRPRPTDPLRSRLRAAVGERSPATADTVAVTGPTYAPVDVTVRLTPAADVSASEARTAVETELAACLHPVTGGEDGEGWPFGTVSPPTAIRAALTSTPVVDSVVSLAATIEGTACSAVELPPNALVCDGVHTVRIDREGLDGDA